MWIIYLLYFITSSIQGQNNRIIPHYFILIQVILLNFIIIDICNKKTAYSDWHCKQSMHYVLIVSYMNFNSTS